MADEKLHEVENAYDKIYGDAKTDNADISVNDIKASFKKGASKLVDKLDKWTIKHPNATFIAVVGGISIGMIELTKKIISDSIYSANKRTFKYMDRTYRK